MSYFWAFLEYGVVGGIVVFLLFHRVGIFAATPMEEINDLEDTDENNEGDGSVEYSDKGSGSALTGGASSTPTGGADSNMSTSSESDTALRDLYDMFDLGDDDVDDADESSAHELLNGRGIDLNSVSKQAATNRTMSRKPLTSNRGRRHSRGTQEEDSQVIEDALKLIIDSK